VKFWIRSFEEDLKWRKEQRRKEKEDGISGRENTVGSHISQTI